MVRLPDFYVVGAPKCGTTSLYCYLRQHAGLFMPEVKEPNFFCSDFASIQKFKTVEDYSKLFTSARESQLIGEASPWYLYSKSAIQNILDVQPNAKFIVMLRNPVDAVISHFNYMRYFLVEDREDILEAVALEDRGMERKAALRHRHAKPFLNYKGLFSYSEQIARIKKLVPAENLLVVFFEEFFQNPAQNFPKITNFLNLPQQNISFEAHNQAKEWRFDFVRKFIVNQSSAPQRVIVEVLRFLKNHNINIRDMILNSLSRDGESQSVDATTRALLQSMFAEDVKALKEMLQLPSSSAWDGVGIATIRQGSTAPRPISTFEPVLG